MDQAWINGHFHTEDRAYPTCEALYARNGIIMAMGTSDEISRLAAEHGITAADLGGKYVLPGFTDSHMHLLEFSIFDQLIHLEGARSLDDVTEVCREKTAWAKENGKWITAVGFNQNAWDKKKIPDRYDLDRISTDVPIVIRRACMHISVCNSKALELMNLPENIPAGEEENFDRFPDGRLTGVIRESSQTLISLACPLPTKEEIRQLILHGCQKLAQKGIVEVQTDDFHTITGEAGRTVIQAFRELAEEDLLPIHVYEQCYLENEALLESFLEDGHYTGQKFGNFCLGPLKIIMDGSLGAHTAYMREDYKDAPGVRGLSYHTKDELYSYMKKGHDAGMQIAVHCIGDQALQDVLDCYDMIRWENPRTDCRHGIVHCQIMDHDQLERFRAMNLIGYVQPVFLRCDMHIVNSEVGDELAAQSYNWRRFLDSGVHLSGGSDSPVETFDIMNNIYYAVTRKDPVSGKEWYPENAVTLEEALRMFTIEGAYTSFSEHEKGSITIGKEANLVVLDQDIFSVPFEQIPSISVLETICKGNTVYRAAE